MHIIDTLDKGMNHIPGEIAGESKIALNYV